MEWYSNRYNKKTAALTRPSIVWAPGFENPTIGEKKKQKSDRPDFVSPALLCSPLISRGVESVGKPRARKKSPLSH